MASETTCLWERDCLRRTGMRDLAASMRCTPEDQVICRPCLAAYARKGVATASEGSRRPMDGENA